MEGVGGAEFNPVNHPRAKHIDTSYHYVRNKVEEGAISTHRSNGDRRPNQAPELRQIPKVQVSHGTSVGQ